MSSVWYKNGSPLISSDKIKCDINDRQHTLKITKAELSDNAVYCIYIEGVKRQIELQVEDYFTNDLAIYPTKPIEGNTISISCEVKQKNMSSVWYKNGSPLISSDKIKCDINDKQHTLEIHNAELSDSAVYCIYIEGVKRQIELQVEVYFSEALAIDPTEPIEGNDISISCEVKQKSISAMWYKNGSPVSSTDKIKCDIKDRKHTLKIKTVELSDKAVYCIDFDGVKRQIQLQVEGKIS
ncbi:MYBPC1 [Mytilus coruscus]|uniref:MYBPC1 n=1 Tax=Mytilus coruscus TaxID=42192 RepID=A0A6J8ASQ6_MYTCO|nr:MYBPC1 [Mytilus coruscus]